MFSKVCCENRCKTAVYDDDVMEDLETEDASANSDFGKFWEIATNSIPVEYNSKE